MIVGFEHGDTRRPIVVGSLFNGKDKPGDDLVQSKDGSFAVASDKKLFMHSKEDMTFKSDKKMMIEITDDAATGQGDHAGGAAGQQAQGRHEPTRSRRAARSR